VPLPAGLRALASRDFRVYFAGTLVSQICTWMHLGTIVVAGCNTSLQLAAPDALRGRIMSLYTLLSGGIFPVSAFFVGAVSEAAGVSRAFALNGVLGLMALTLLISARRRRRPPALSP